MRGTFVTATKAITIDNIITTAIINGAKSGASATTHCSCDFTWWLLQLLLLLLLLLVKLCILLQLIANLRIQMLPIENLII